MDKEGFVKLALKEAVWAREDIVRYSARHPDVHDPEDVEKYQQEADEMSRILKDMK